LQRNSITRANDMSIPPSAGLPFITFDEGNCGPKYIRPTTIIAP